MMPFLANVNTYDQVAFSPAHNYHSNIIDWRCVIIDIAKSREQNQ